MAGRAVCRAAALTVLMLVGSAGVAQASAPGRAGRLVTGAEVVRTLAAGRSFRADHLRIRGDVDLSGLSRVRGSFRCTSCTFHGSLTAADVKFGDVVDLAGSHLRGGIDMRGAIFDRSAVFTGAVVRGDARFDMTVFGSSASFDNMTFDGRTTFAGTRFRGDATFDASDFYGPARFAGATFAGDALFGGLAAGRAPGAASARCKPRVAGAFGSQAVFAAVAFHGRADFGGRCFAGTANFSGITVTGRADFDSAEFVGTAIFEHASFGDDASFTFATFRNDARFHRVSATRNLTFDAADFGPDLDLTGAAVRGTLSLATPFLPPEVDTDIDIDASVGGMVLDPGAVGARFGKCDVLPCTPVAILQKVDETARASGDTATANAARFDWLEKSGQARLDNGNWWSRIGVFLQDRLIYQWIAGYLVRPLHPVVAFVAFLALGILVRIFRSPKRANDQPAPGTPPKSAAARQPDPAAQAAGIPAAATPGDSELSQAGPPGRSRSTTGPAAEPTPGGSSMAHSPSEAGTLTSPGTPSGVSHGRARRRRDPSHWIRAFFETGAVAFSVRPPEQLTKVTKDAIAEDIAKASSLGVALRWAEYAWFKVLAVLAIMCVANYNETLHQFIESIFHW
jgi:hypothetical protein